MIGRRVRDVGPGCCFAGLAVASAMLVGCASVRDVRQEPSAPPAALGALAPAVVFDDEPVPRWTLQQRMRRYRVPAVSIAFIDEGRLAWSAAVGLRDGKQPVDTRTLFQAASLSKPVAAAVALSLVEDGVLDLDAGVNAQLSEWQLPSTASFSADEVSLRRLLSHTAGTNIHGFAGYPSGSPLPDALQILEGQAPANSPAVRLIQAPGSGYRYSGGGYQIVQQLVSSVTGKPFDEVARDRLLRPLSMDRTVFTPDPPDTLRGNTAIGHGYDGTAHPGGWNRYPELAAAALWSTPEDLASFLVALLEGLAGEGHEAMPANVARRMATEALEGMGLGFGVHGAGAARVVDHSGATRGYRTYMAAFPERGQGFVIMTNADGGGDLIGEIRRGLAVTYGWPAFEPKRMAAEPLSAAALEAREGTYMVQTHGFPLTLRHEDGMLVAETPRGSRYHFRPTSHSSFVAIEDGAELSFDTAQPDRVRLWGMVADRVAPSTAPASVEGP